MNIFRVFCLSGIIATASVMAEGLPILWTRSLDDSDVMPSSDPAVTNYNFDPVAISEIRHLIGDGTGGCAVWSRRGVASSPTTSQTFSRVYWLATDGTIKWKSSPAWWGTGGVALGANVSVQLLHVTASQLCYRIGAQIAGPGDGQIVCVTRNQDGSFSESSTNLTETSVSFDFGRADFLDRTGFANQWGGTGFFARVGTGAIRKYSPLVPPTPTLVITSFSGVANGNIVIQWMGDVGVSYQIQQSSDLNAWTNVGLPISGTGIAINHSTPIPGGVNSLFLRVVVP